LRLSALSGAPRGAAGSPESFEDDTQAARAHMALLMRHASTPTITRFAEATRSGGAVEEQVPEMVEQPVVQLALTATKLVPFEQRRDGIPVFGSRVVVELDNSRGLVSSSMMVADVENVNTRPNLEIAEATDILASRLNCGAEVLPEPKLTILPLPETGERHLAWHFASVLAEPPADPEARPSIERGPGGCCDLRGGSLPPDYDYFIDAANGALLFQFSNHARVDVPTWCRGEDEDGSVQTFFGRSHTAGFEMNNNFEDIKTFDMKLQTIEGNPLPTNPVQSATNHWQANNRAAVSAHVNSARVMDFLFSILRRDSIDDSGYVVENIVNCTSGEVPASDRPEWINAAWWQGKMWYGQKRYGTAYVSLARHLDIVAHELFHGVTEHTSDLVYKDLSGALNESFSDIFGIIIQNWYQAPDRLDQTTWDWGIGVGLAVNGEPLRHFAKPSSVGKWSIPNTAGPGWKEIQGYPDHMSAYIPLTYDHGGVHIFSNIHNKAAHNLFTATLADGTPTLSVQETAVLYYLTLVRLGRLADFSDARAELLSVASTLYGGSAGRLQEVEAAITSAYDAVGIS
jgi:bacillolysin